MEWGPVIAAVVTTFGVIVVGYLGYRRGKASSSPLADDMKSVSETATSLMERMEKDLDNAREERDELRSEVAKLRDDLKKALVRVDALERAYIAMGGDPATLNGH